MSQENPASRKENPEYHGKPAPREDAVPEEGNPEPPESQENPAPREESPVPGGDAESTGETAAESSGERSAVDENEASDSDEGSEKQAQRRLVKFWIASACAVFVLVTAHMWALGAFRESGPAPFSPKIQIPTLSAASPSTEEEEEEEESSSPESKARTNPVNGDQCENVDGAARPYKEGKAYESGGLAVQVLDFDPNALGRLKASHRPAYSEDYSKPAKLVGLKLRLTNSVMKNLNLKGVKILFVDTKLKCEGEEVSLHPNVKPGALMMERELEPGRSVEGWIYFRMDPAFSRGKIYIDLGKADIRVAPLGHWLYEIDKVFTAS